MISAALAFSSCKDDEPPRPPKLSFETSTMTVKESDGAIQVKVVLDKAAAEDLTIDYSIGGTAIERNDASGPFLPDYIITSGYQKLEIPKGELEQIIELRLNSDTDLEDEENIVFTIDAVSSQEVEIAGNNIDIKVQQEDGLIVQLSWGNADALYPDVDMDLFIWLPNASGTLVLVPRLYGFSNNSPRTQLLSTTPLEFIFLPAAVTALNDGPIGVSANYYSGTQEPMQFKIEYIKFVNGAPGAPEARSGTYSNGNINPWLESQVWPLLVATFRKSGTDFLDFSDIAVPAAGSRQVSGGTEPVLGLKRFALR
jgi:hypothetical protein